MAQEVGAESTSRSSAASARSRAKASAKAQGGTLAASFVFPLTVAVLAVAPFSFGSIRPAPLAAIATAVAVLMLLWGALALIQAPPLRLAWPLLPAGLLIIGVLAWSLVQATPGLLPSEWTHPNWQLAKGHGLEVTPLVSMSATAYVEPFLRLAGGASMFVLGFLLAQREETARALLLSLLAITTGYAALGLLRWLVGLEFMGDPQGRRISSSFVNPNHFATYANLGLVIAAAFLIEPLLREKSGGNLRSAIADTLAETFERRSLITLAFFLLLAASIGTLSRGGLLSLFVALAFAVGAGLAVARLRGRTFMAAIAGAGLVLGFTFWLVGEPVLKRFDDLGTETDAARQGRLAVWELTLEQIEEQLWLGHGHGTYEQLFLQVRDERFPGTKARHAHNDYLELLVELGLPAGIALLAALLILFGWCLWGVVRRRRGRIYPLVAASALVLVATHALVDFSLVLPAVMITLAAILGIGCAQARRLQ